MIIASQKKKENIAEYLLYMWQIEDLLRAYKFDINAVKANIVDRYDQPEEVKMEILDWYGYLIDMMRTEEVQTSGHIQINKNVLIDLTDLHLRLLKAPKEQFYAAAYYQTLPYIVELRSKAGDDPHGEIETCFDALYGFLLLKMQQKPVSEETMKAIKQISTFLALLSDKYKKDRAGELELE